MSDKANSQKTNLVSSFGVGRHFEDPIVIQFSCIKSKLDGMIWELAKSRDRLLVLEGTYNYIEMLLNEVIAWTNKLEDWQRKLNDLVTSLEAHCHGCIVVLSKSYPFLKRCNVSHVQCAFTLIYGHVYFVIYIFKLTFNVPLEPSIFLLLYIIIL